MSVTNATLSLPTNVADEVIANVVSESAVMQLARRIDLPGRGVTIPVIAADPTAHFVDETEVKPTSDPTISPKVMKPRTISIIIPFSNQFKNSEEALYEEIVERLPKVLGQRFDEEVFHGTAVSGFDTLTNSTAVALGSDAWEGLVTAKGTIEEANGELTGFAMSNQGETALMGEKDASGRPLFVGGIADGGVPRLLGVDSVKAKAAYKAGSPNTLAFAGDWDKAVYGIANDVQVSISEEATLTGVGNLWEKNMFAVRAEMEVGFVAGIAGQFVKITA